ncbi:unnamed protein product [Rotaria magnacalcarata]|uniref:G domain-containing protein n=3 Tax=Rotaria magnacalcarata TaxID=392030 RepID=A0A814D5I9_9BILA|nr:unnamed protein product [Rotaria magnacalcarata]CAF1241033.1 unnamed protein product [Rotaria magnacalcarata]
MGKNSSNVSKSQPNFERAKAASNDSNDAFKTKEIEILLNNIQQVIDSMKMEVKSNPMFPMTLFNALFNTLGSLTETLNPTRSHTCYCLGGTDVGKSSLINSIARSDECKIGENDLPCTDGFKIVHVEDVNATFVDSIGFGAQLDDSVLVTRTQKQMENIERPDAVIIVVTKNNLRTTVSLDSIMKNVNSVLKYQKQKRHGTSIPVICVLSKIDEYFKGQAPNSEGDVKQLEEYTERALKSVNKYLIDPAVQCIPVSTRYNYGVDQLRLSINAQSPLNAQIIDKNLDFISRSRLSIANKIIAAFSTASAAASFLPLIDIVIVTFLQEWMYRMLACFSIDPNRTPNTFKAVHRIQQTASIAIRAGALFIGGALQLSLVGYFIGTSICVVTAATSTAALGWASYFYFVD